MTKIIEIPELASIARQIRIDILKSLTEAGSGHLGGSLGLTDVFTCLYFNILNHDSENPNWEDRDRLILSIGHVAPVLYASLANAGYFDRKELKTLRKLGSRLQGHPSKSFDLPGIEISSGSLGQGLSVSVGLAISAKYDKKEWRVYTIMGDGEIQEGSVWEAAMSANHYKLDNLCAVIDRNYCQIDGDTEDVMSLEPLTDKWRAFGWHVINCNGHNFEDLIGAFEEAKKIEGKPTLIIANTKMGKGIPSIEGDFRWHGKVPTKEQRTDFLKELH